jgi:N-acetylglucosaminyldiphosphoundecaprenol N-acetyl-beta-D-mannosaminyltransferase
VDKVDVLGVKFDALNMSEAISRAMELVKSGGYVVTPNAEIAYACYKDPKYLQAVNAAALIVPDGVGVLKGAKVLKRPLKERVPGIELGERLLPLLAENGLSLYILGGKPGVARRAAANLKEKYPGLIIAGASDGYFADDGEAVEKVNASGADVCFVCMGAPRQEYFMRDNAWRLKPKLLLGLGGSVDGYAGDVRRAPRLFRTLGLEWFYRLLAQPSRIGRVAKRLPPFVFAVYAQRRRERREENARRKKRAAGRN